MNQKNLKITQKDKIAKTKYRELCNERRRYKRGYTRRNRYQNMSEEK